MVAPDAQLTFFETANKGEFPDPSAFDLIVLGGGNVDPRKSHQWILDVHKFIKDLVVKYPSKKILGICWGHQTIARIFGGRVVEATPPEVSPKGPHRLTRPTLARTSGPNRCIRLTNPPSWG